MIKKVLQISLIILFAALSANLYAGVLLDVKSFKVSANTPAEFIFDLLENDRVNFSFDIIGGNLDRSKVRVQFIDLNTVEEEIIDEFGIPYGDHKILYDGKYKLRISYDGKVLMGKTFSTGLFRLKVESNNTPALQPGEYRTLMRAASIALDEDRDNSLKLIIPVNKGDQISIICNSQAASLAKVNLVQLSKTGSLSQMANIIAEQDYNLTVKIYLEDDGSSLLNKLLKSGNNSVDDLNISITKALKATSSSSSPSNPSSSGIPTQEDSQADVMRELEANRIAEMQRQQDIMDQSTENSNEYQQASLELQKMSLDQTQKMIEMQMEAMNRKKKLINAIPIKPKRIKLGPSENLFKSNSSASAPNKQCVPLQLGGSSFNQWFYWIGVGKESEKAFIDAKDNYEMSISGRKTLAGAKAEYIYYLNDPAVNRSNPRFASKSEYPNLFGEDVIFAIVDDYNRENFLKGSRYTDINYNASGKSVSTTIETAFFPPKGSDTLYHACFCNDNKRTPIEVSFKYYTIEVQDDEY